MQLTIILTPIKRTSVSKVFSSTSLFFVFGLSRTYMPPPFHFSFVTNGSGTGSACKWIITIKDGVVDVFIEKRKRTRGLDKMVALGVLIGGASYIGWKYQHAELEEPEDK